MNQYFLLQTTEVCEKEANDKWMIMMKINDTIMLECSHNN